MDDFQNLNFSIFLLSLWLWSLAAPPPEMVNNAIDALKRAQRNFQETFYETPPIVEPTVRIEVILSYLSSLFLNSLKYICILYVTFL